MKYAILFFKIITKSSFSGANDIPVLDFWVSKPEWAAFFPLSGIMCVVQSLNSLSLYKFSLWVVGAMRNSD